MAKDYKAAQAELTEIIAKLKAAGAHINMAWQFEGDDEHPQNESLSRAGCKENLQEALELLKDLIKKF